MFGGIIDGLLEFGQVLLLGILVQSVAQAGVDGVVAGLGLVQEEDGLATGQEFRTNEACHLFTSDLKPIVCAHDSSIKSIRVTSTRPQIIKLHGDFLFDNIKNTATELETLESNTRAKFKQYAAEYGVIVVGYAGHDRSVMDTLNLLLRSEDSFPHGIYWCVTDPDKIPNHLIDLANHPRVELVEIQGFDEFFAEMHDFLGHPLQEEMSNPYGALQKRLNSLIDATKVPQDTKAHPVIERDISTLAKTVLDRHPMSTADGDGADSLVPERISDTPFQLLAEVALRENRNTDAKAYTYRQLEQAITPVTLEMGFRVATQLRDTKLAEDLVAKLDRDPEIVSDSPELCADYCVSLLRLGEPELARKVLEIQINASKTTGIIDDEYWHINMGQVERRLGNPLSPDLEKRLLEISLESPLLFSKLGASVVLGNFEKARLIYNDDLRPTDQDAFMAWPIAEIWPPEERPKKTDLPTDQHG